MFEQDLIKTKKNILAFSAGVDSSALFFILLQNNIEFDIAIVNYNQRIQSKDEIQYAQKLAKQYNKNIYTKTYDNSKFSEKKARDFRYDFFDELILKHNYEALITAHQLNDKLEWFLMQLSKGAGIIELMGLKNKSYRKNYIVYKPLLETSKNTLEEYLKKNNHKYYIDSTNFNDTFKRNKIRNSFANEFLNEYENGIKNSFLYIQNDINSLESNHKTLKLYDLSVTKFTTNDMNILIKYIDKKLKKFGIIISSHTRNEIIKQKAITISNQINITIKNNIIYISPIKNMNMNKKFKELCRTNKIPKNIRPYLYSINKDEVSTFLAKLKQYNI